jgi:hypothetical protein
LLLLLLLLLWRSWNSSLAWLDSARVSTHNERLLLPPAVCT